MFKPGSNRLTSGHDKRKEYKIYRQKEKEKKNMILRAETNTIKAPQENFGFL